MGKSGKNGPPPDQELSAGASVVMAKLREIKSPQSNEGFSWQKILSEFPVISKAPYSFAITTLMVAAIGIGVLWYLGLLVPGVIVTTKNATIESLTNQVSDYKIKLEGATPTEAKAEISKLKEQTAILEQRTNEKDELIAKLKENLARLETRQVEVLRSTTTQNSDGKYKIVRDIAVKSYSTPNYLFITVKSKGLVEASVGNSGVMVSGNIRPSPDVWVDRIVNPVGNYQITVLTAADEADITYRFE